MKIKIQTQTVSIELEDEVNVPEGSSWAWHKIPDTEAAFAMVVNCVKELHVLKEKENGLTK